MNSKLLFRYRIKYVKTSAIRFTGHLDMLRAWERTFRRARLPIGYSQGFNPRPRINMGVPLPLGYTSECEVMDIWLTEKIQPSVLLENIRKALPPGLELQKITQVDESALKLQQIIRTAEYQISLDPFPLKDDLEKRIAELLESTTILRERKGKTYDLRPLLHSIKILSESNRNILSIILSAQEGATGRPDEILNQLGLDPHKALIHRKTFALTTSDDIDITSPIKI